MVKVQSLISQLFGTPSDDGGSPYEFWDLFCGIGGASTGAKMAGLNVKFACDYSAGALESHAHNHPEAVHKCMPLPASNEELMLPTDGRPFWIHGSPPCTRLSTMQMLTDPSKTEEAIALVRWYIELATRVSPQHWSMEQVGHPRITTLLDAMKRSNRMIDYIVIDFADIGVPQHRRRLLAGPPRAIDRIRAFQSTERHVPIGRACPSMPTEAKYIRNSLVNDTRGGGTGPRLPIRKSLRRVTRPSFTVVTTIAGRWYGANKKIVRSLSIRECMIAQAFPESYSFPAGVNRKRQLLGVGNSIPPMAMALLLGKRPPPPPRPRHGERGACPDESNTENDSDTEVDPCIKEEAAQSLSSPLSPPLKAYAGWESDTDHESPPGAGAQRAAERRRRPVSPSLLLYPE